MSLNVSKPITMVCVIALLQVAGCQTTTNTDAHSLRASSSSGTVRPISVPSDPKAQYYILERGSNGSLRTITTKRVGTSGSSYSKRLYNCAQSTVKYLGTGDTLAEMNQSTPPGKMANIVSGSIAYYIGLEACR